jgi:hypothetical protein
MSGSSNVFKKVADALQRGAVLGLFSVFAFQAYQIGSNVYQNKIDHPSMHDTYFNDVDEKVKKEYENAHRIDYRGDWYPADDDEPNPFRPEDPKQKQKQQQDGQQKSLS